MKISQRLMKLRLAHGDSLRDAAARTGVSHTTIARIEKGEVTGSFTRTLHRIADGYRVAPEWLHSGRDPRGHLEAQVQTAAIAAEVTEYVQAILQAKRAGVTPELLALAIDLLAARQRVAAGRC